MRSESMPEATAPGKLLLTGEYAVLRGAPAVCVSVDATARAVAETGPGPHELTDRANGKRYPFAWMPGEALRWLEADPADRGTVLDAVLATIGLQYPDLPLPGGLKLALDARGFVAADGPDAQKLGLGSSAAVTVALVGALFAVLGLGTNRARIAELACAAHSRLQGGRGSGADILTAVYGGVVAVYPSANGPRAEPLRWPEPLELVLVWSGQSASTPAMIRRFEQYARSSPAAPELRALADTAGLAALAWRDEDPGAVLSATAAFAGALNRLDEMADLGILSPGHRQLAALSRRAGALYKTSGAGGGDLGFALTDKAAVADRLRRDFCDAGFPVIDRAVAVRGLLIGA